MASRAHRPIERKNDNITFETIGVSLLTPSIGAEISGVDLSRPISTDQLAEIKQALVQHFVLVFRDQQITRDDHKRFGRHFGQLHTHPYHSKTATGGEPTRDPEILPVLADQNSRYVAGEGWHADVTCDEEPPFGSMLHITHTPEVGCGGDTCFLNAYDAYDALSPAMKEFFEEKNAVHDGSKPYSRGYGITPPEGGWPRATHPILPRHPDSGRKILYVNRGFTTQIEGLAPIESEAMLEMLWRHLETNPAFQCRVRWEPNTLVFWDNRCVQHHAVWDYYPFSRRGERVSIVGGRPSR